MTKVLAYVYYEGVMISSDSLLVLTISTSTLLHGYGRRRFI